MSNEPMAATPPAGVSPEDLERRLGDPWERDNPVGLAAILAADERAEPLEAGELLLDSVGFGGELVPVAEGGRLDRADRLFSLMRVAVRRDPVLGFGYGMSSLMASAAIWTGGDERQRAAAAATLLADGKLACAFYEPEHGNDLTRTECRADPGPVGLVLTGRKQVIGNLHRAKSVLLYARTSAGPGSRSHSLLLIDRARLPTDAARSLPRTSSSGLRGMQLGGIEFLRCPVPGDAVVGPTGHGLEIALRAFQLSRVAIPAAAVGALDTALRTATRFALGRRLYGASVADMPYPRAVLADAFADLLLADAMTGVAARALHLLPDESGTTAAAVKYLVPKVLAEATVALSVLVGAHSYLRTGEHAMMQKLVRDVRPVGLVHASPAVCLMSLLPRLPAAARRSWTSARAPAPDVFALGDDLPPLSFDRLVVGTGGSDRLGAALHAMRAELPVDGDPQLRRLADQLADELHELARECAGLRPAQLSATAPRHSYRLAHSYTVLLAAGCCLGVWLNARPSPGPDPGGFRNDPAWVIAVLTRLLARLRPGPRIPVPIRERLIAELLHRCHTSVALDHGRIALSPWSEPGPD